MKFFLAASNLEQTVVVLKVLPLQEFFDANSAFNVWRKEVSCKHPNFLKEGHKKKKRLLNRVTDNSVDGIKDNFSPDTCDTDMENNEKENNYEEDEHIEQYAGISCKSADKVIQEDQCSEEYVNHDGRQGSEIKFVEQTVTQRSDKRKKQHSDLNSKAAN